ncbi:hypothetical protein LJK87_28975 [Paenibacillus sp. P25]|nr:hypothetical protein LJK87_28975 [Paenibacillus sp. P25]
MVKNRGPAVLALLVLLLTACSHGDAPAAAPQDVSAPPPVATEAPAPNKPISEEPRLESVQSVQVAQIPVEEDRTEPFLADREDDKKIISRLVGWIGAPRKGSPSLQVGKRRSRHVLKFRWGLR